MNKKIIRAFLSVTCISSFCASAWAETPASPAAAQQPAQPPAQGAPEAKQEALLIGILFKQRPIRNSSDVRAYTGEWLQATGLKTLMPGKTVQVGGIFVVDLLDAADKKTVQNQLILRKRDGLVFLVYPSNLNPPKGSPELRMGMAGLEGMAGMAGMPRPVKTVGHGSGAIESVREAKRAADAWLWYNQIRDVEVVDVKAVGGVYVGNLRKSKPPRNMVNQFVARKADGFLILVSPYQLPKP